MSKLTPTPPIETCTHPETERTDDTIRCAYCGAEVKG